MGSSSIQWKRSRKRKNISVLIDCSQLFYLVYRATIGSDVIRSLIYAHINEFGNKMIDLNSKTLRNFIANPGHYKEMSFWQFYEMLKLTELKDRFMKTYVEYLIRKVEWLMMRCHCAYYSSMTVFIVIDGPRKYNWRKVTDPQFQKKISTKEHVSGEKFTFNYFTLLPLLYRSLGEVKSKLEYGCLDSDRNINIKIANLSDYRYFITDSTDNKVPCSVEADDIIAVYTQYIRKPHETDVFIVSTDSDFNQLEIPHSGVRLIDFRGKCRNTRAPLHRTFFLGKPSISAEKIMSNVQFDQLEERLTHMEEERSTELSQMWKERIILEYLDEIDVDPEKYRDNLRLCSFNNIPEEIRYQICNRFPSDKM